MADALPATPASRRRPGLGGAFLLVLATLVTAHMPVVVGMGYAPWNAEVLLSLAFLAGVAGLSAALLYRVPLLLHVFACFWVYWALDAYLPDTAVTRSLAWVMALTGTDLEPTTWQWLLCLLPPVVVVAVLSTRVADNVRAMLLTFACVWFLGLWWSPDRALLRDDTLAVSAAQESASPTASTRPPGTSPLRPVIHLILDEHTSPRVQPAAMGIAHPAKAMVNDYLARGFELHSHVIAPAGRTHNSLSAALNFKETENAQRPVRSRSERFRFELADNAYVTSLRTLGYRTVVVQNSYLRICPTDGSATCLTHTTGKTGSIGPFVHANIADRIAVLLFEIDRSFSDSVAYPVQAYALFRTALARAGLQQTYAYAYYTNPIASMNLLQMLRERLLRIAPGEAYIVHLILPHAPFMLNADCTVKPYRAWTSSLRNALEPATAPRLDQLQSDYWDQAACVHRHVMELIDATRSSSDVHPLIVVHGDHGARLDTSHAQLDVHDPHSIDAQRTFLAFGTARPDAGLGRERGAPISLPALLVNVMADVERAAGSSAQAAN